MVYQLFHIKQKPDQDDNSSYRQVWEIKRLLEEEQFLVFLGGKFYPGNENFHSLAQEIPFQRNF